MKNKILDTIKQHLKESATNFINVLELETEKAIAKKISYANIKEKYGSLSEFLKHLVEKHDVNNLQIERRKKHGNTNVQQGIALNVGVNIDDGTDTSLTSAAPMQTPQQTPLFNTETKTAPTNYGYEQYYRDKIADLKEKVFDLKTDLQDEKADKKALRKKLNDAHDELREMKVKLATHDKKMELELLKKDIEKKSFFESEGAQKMIDGVMNVGVSLAGARQQAAAPTTLNAPPPSTEQQGKFKTQLLELLSYPDANEEFCEIILAVSNGLVLKADILKPALQKLIVKHQLTV